MEFWEQRDNWNLEIGRKSRKKFLDKTGLEKKAKFKAIAMRAKNKPTFLQSQFVGHDAAGCFKKYENMEWIDWKEQNWLKKG